MTLADAAKALPPRPQVNRSEPKALTRQLEVKGVGDTVEATVNLPEKTTDTPEGAARSLLEDYGLDPEQYVVTGFRSSEWTMANGETGTSTRFVFGKVGTGSAPAIASVMPDLDDLHRTIKRDRRKPVVFTVTQEKVSVLGIIADAQFGKNDHRGGVEETIRRLEESRARFEAYCKKVKPAEIILFDAGDSIEGFDSGDGSADRTNDLTLTEQIRVWRRVFWSWIDTASRLAPSVKVLSVGSNHCRVRKGKLNMGTATEDFGVEVLTQVQDMASVYPEKYGHVEFFAPGRFEDAVAIESVGGKVLGLAHGHQVGQPARLGDYLMKQAAGRTPIGGADIVIFGHFHSYLQMQWGGDRWLWVAPTSDNGSSWYRNIAGVESAPGVLAMTLDERGWRDPIVL